MAGKVRDYPKLASDIIEIVGKDNITGATRCATRLRLVLKETPEGAADKVKKLNGVITVAESGGQFQVVIGTHVGEVFEAAKGQLNLSDTDAGANQGTWLNRVIATMSAVFAPFVYILAAAGILQGSLILITLAVPSFADTGTHAVLDFMSWTPFTYLPVFIGLTAARHFKCNEFIALLCCLALVNPSWAEIAGRIADGERLSLFFIPLAQTTYTSTVLPPLFLVLCLSYVERFFNKYIPETFRALLVPFCCFLVIVPLTLLILGPVSEIISNALANGYNWAYNIFPPIAAAVVGFFWQVFVIFGVHWGFTPLTLANLEVMGYDTFQPFSTIAVCAQVGACLGVVLRTKNKEFKNMAFSSFVTGLFGITEPIIYGVTLRLKKPFICGCIGGAVGSAVAAFMGVRQYVYAGLGSYLTIVNAYSASNPMSVWGEALGVLLGTVIGCGLVFVVGFEDVPVDSVDDEEAEKMEYIPQEPQVSAADFDNAMAKDHTVLVAPIAGEAIPLSSVKDEVFASGAMGKGAAIRPVEGKVYSPVDGTINLVFDTKHAIGIQADDGQELLIHFGMDTVNLQGDGFDAKVKVGDKVKTGDLLLEVDLDKVKAAGYSTETPVLVVNADSYEDVLKFPEAVQVKPGDDFVAVIK